jgi:uncharacterized protein
MEYEEIANAIIQRNAKLDVQDHDAGSTALMHASIRGINKIASSLVASGAKLDVKDKEGNTALIRAIEAGNEYMSLVLIEKGADVNVKNQNSLNALMVPPTITLRDESWLCVNNYCLC